MTKHELIKLIDELIEYPIETEWIEFKHNKSLQNKVIGEYISALSNSANIHNKPFAYLIWVLKIIHIVLLAHRLV